MVNSSDHHQSKIKLKCTILFILNGLYLKFSLLPLSTVLLFDQPALSGKTIFLNVSFITLNHFDTDNAIILHYTEFEH